jgi:hypothetical protein
MFRGSSIYDGRRRLSSLAICTSTCLFIWSMLSLVALSAVALALRAQLVSSQNTYLRLPDADAAVRTPGPPFASEPPSHPSPFVQSAVETGAASSHTLTPIPAPLDPNTFPATDPSKPPTVGSSAIPDFGGAWASAYKKAQRKVCFSRLWFRVYLPFLHTSNCRLAWCACLECNLAWVVLPLLERRVSSQS